MLRRRFAIHRASAGLIAGTLGGRAGVGLLALHCPNFQAAHILVWHRRGSGQRCLRRTARLGASFSRAFTKSLARGKKHRLSETVADI
jgi:hypothetical protein